jgi:hypothetical protein
MLDAMSGDLADLEREIGALLDQLDRLYEEAEAAIDQISDPDRAFKRASDLAEKARIVHLRIAGRFAKLRARQAVRIRDEQALSLQGLADRISTSKARADQLVRDASKGAAS